MSRDREEELPRKVHDPWMLCSLSSSTTKYLATNSRCVMSIYCRRKQLYRMVYINSQQTCHFSTYSWYNSDSAICSNCNLKSEHLWFLKKE